MLTQVPGCWWIVNTAGEVGSIREYPGLACSWLPKGPDPAGACACKLAREVHRKRPQATVRLLQGIGATPAWLLLDEGVVGREGGVGRARVEVQELSPLWATVDRHATTTPW